MLNFGGDAPGVFRAFSGVNQLRENVGGAALFCWRKLMIHALRVSRQCLLDAADTVIRGMRQHGMRRLVFGGKIGLLLPHFRERKFQKRQIAGAMPDRIEDALGETLFKHDAIGARGLFNHVAQFVAPHRSQPNAPILRKFRKRRRTQRFSQKIGAHGQQARGGKTGRLRDAQQALEKKAARLVVAAERVKFFELIKNQ